ncbi:winged helix-turn-helix transcriptional regulator [Pararhodobacter marinus]|nr:helix-turn-helix domain-containing protein [Pararhodobacter marinus]
MPPIDQTADRARAMLDAFGRANVMAAECPSRALLQHLTSRWGVLVMAALATGTHRFAQLRRRIGGVSERMLAQTLQQLERDGFVHRHDHGEVPPRVDYALTPLGQQAAGHIVSLVGWLEDSLPAILEAQAAGATASPDRSARASA